MSPHFSLFGGLREKIRFRIRFGNSSEGSISYEVGNWVYIFDEKKKRWIARFSSVDKVTRKQKEFKRLCLTKTEARKKLDELRQKYEKSGGGSINADKATFVFLAAKYKKERLVPAVYAGERKIAGPRELTSPEGWLKQLLFFFGPAKLNEITRGRIEQFKLWLTKLPTRSRILEKEGGELELITCPKGKQRKIESINRPVELLRVMLKYAVDERMITPDQNPFSQRSTRALIERAAETERERFPTFGEELALINCVVFDIKGNNYRLITIILYPVQHVYIRYVLTHAEYDKGNWKNDCNC